MGGHDYRNSRSNPREHILNPRTVDDLATKWLTTTRGDVSATPAVVNGAVYFPDWGGFFSKVEARTGRLIWSRQVAEYVGKTGVVSRSSPAVVGNTVYIGTQQDARLLAIDTGTGQLRWSTRLDTHPHAILTQSPMVFNGVVYQGVSSQEETAAIDPTYPCCTFRGSLAAVDAATGEILWQIPEPHQGIAMAAMSTANGVVFAGSLNGHMYALDAATGEVRWQMQGEGASNAEPAIVNGTVYWGNGYARNGFGAASTTFYAFHTNHLVQGLLE